MSKINQFMFSSVLLGMRKETKIKTLYSHSTGDYLGKTSLLLQWDCTVSVPVLYFSLKITAFYSK